MISILKNLLNVSLCGKLPRLSDNYKNPSNDEEQVVHDVYVWLFHNRYDDLRYHVCLMWNAIRALYATGMNEVSDEDVCRVLIDDPRSSTYFISDHATEVTKIMSLANMFLKKWKNIYIEKQGIPFDLRYQKEKIPSMHDLMFYDVCQEPDNFKRACKLDRNKSF